MKINYTFIKNCKEYEYVYNVSLQEAKSAIADIIIKAGLLKATDKKVVEQVLFFCSDWIENFEDNFIDELREMFEDCAREEFRSMYEN